MKPMPVLLVCALISTGCRGWPGRPAAQPDPLEAPAAGQPLLGTPGPAAAPPGTATQPVALVPTQITRSATVATVNGRPIYMEELLTPLLESYGLRTADMLVQNLVVAQEAARLDIAVTDKDIAAEQDRSVRGIFGDQMTPDQRQQVLDELLARRGLTRPLWDAVMRRNAVLRKMAQPRVIVTDAMVQSEYDRQFGEKIQVAHVQVPSISEAEKIIQMLKAGEDFAALARRFSTNSATAKDGGLLPPFARQNVSVPQAMRDAAFALQPGQISGIVQVGNDFNVLRCEKRFIPPQADFEKVKDKLRADLQASLVEHVQQEILSELRRKADVQYVNPVLRKAAAGGQVNSNQ